ncbi:hypothetical protein Tco_0730700 [Tanacetum coccineum]
MKKVHRLLSMTDGDERKHVLDYTHVDLHCVEDQRKNLVNKFNLLKQEQSLHKFELCNLKNTVSINCSLQNEVIKVNLKNESPKDEISDLKKIIENGLAEPLPPLPKLIRAAPAGTSKSLISLADLTLNMADLTLNTSVPKKTKPSSVIVSPAYVIKKRNENKPPAVPESYSDKKADSSTKQLLLTLMEECSTCGSTYHLTKEHLDHVVVKKTLIRLKAQSPLNPTPRRAPMIPKPFKECKYCGFNDHHSDKREYYPRCEVCGSVVHELADSPKKHPNNRKPRIANKQSIEPTEKYSKESGPKVVFRDDSSGDTKGYGLVNCNVITFVRVAYVNGLKHNLIKMESLSPAEWIRGLPCFNSNNLLSRLKALLSFPPKPSLEKSLSSACSSSKGNKIVRVLPPLTLLRTTTYSFYIPADIHPS